MRRLYWLLERVIASDVTTLVVGENGTGKELVARAIHERSARAAGRFVAQNCAALNENLLESALFGHRRGAFTGAVSDQQGLFELADRGTLFLDEVGEMSTALQAKLLRVLQEGIVTPVGDTRAKQVDVRIVAATNRDLRRLVARGRFRQDFFYRLAVVTLRCPPLRQRADDVLLLADHFVERLAARAGRLPKRLGPACRELLATRSWPGNVRELQNEIERLVVLAGDAEEISAELLAGERVREVPGELDLPALVALGLPAAVSQLERLLIRHTLERTAGNRTRAAAQLQISRRNLIRKIQRYGLDSDGS